MDDVHFDTFSRTLGAGRSRRGLTRLLGGFALSGPLALLGPSQVEAKRKKKCGPCKRRKKGKCKPKPDGTRCSADKVCGGGTCSVLACGAGRACRVFLSSVKYTGALGGLAGADAKCQALASAAGLLGTYQAWLSDDTSSPSSRFVRSSGPYQLVNGTTIAANFADLTDGTLLASIKVTETGSTVVFPDDLAWTNTRSDGARDDDNQQCANWSSNSELTLGGLGRARSDSAWTEGGFDDCASPSRLYCFQQS